jgi:hypothetical protein
LGKKAVRRRIIPYQGTDYNNGNKIGHIRNGLDSPFERDVLYFVEEYGQYDWGGKPENNGKKAYGKCVPQQPEEIRVVEKGLKVPETHPLAAHYAEVHPVILKGDNQAVHGLVTKKNEIRQDGQNEQILVLVPAEIFCQSMRQ